MGVINQKQKQFDRYSKVRKIGEGAEAKVFLVKKKSDKNQFALKEIILLSHSKHNQELIKEKVKLESKLNHPNIA